MVNEQTNIEMKGDSGKHFINPYHVYIRVPISPQSCLLSANYTRASIIQSFHVTLLNHARDACFFQNRNGGEHQMQIDHGEHFQDFLRKVILVARVTYTVMIRMLTLIMLRKQIEEMPPIMREIPMQQSRNLQNRDMAT